MKEDISLYQWIYEYLLMMIQCGVVSHGESLPPIWDLADKFHVSIRPVQQAWVQQKQFVADASHEIKTPLTVVLTNADILLQNHFHRDNFLSKSQNLFNRAREIPTPASRQRCAPYEWASALC